MKTRQEIMNLILDHFKNFGPKSQEAILLDMLKRVDDMNLYAMAHEFGLIGKTEVEAI